MRCGLPFEMRVDAVVGYTCISLTGGEAWLARWLAGRLARITRQMVRRLPGRLRVRVAQRLARIARRVDRRLLGGLPDGLLIPFSEPIDGCPAACLVMALTLVWVPPPSQLRLDAGALAATSRRRGSGVQVNKVSLNTSRTSSRSRCMGRQLIFPVRALKCGVNAGCIVVSPVSKGVVANSTEVVRKLTKRLQAHFLRDYMFFSCLIILAFSLSRLWRRTFHPFFPSAVRGGGSSQAPLLPSAQAGPKTMRSSQRKTHRK